MIRVDALNFTPDSEVYKRIPVKWVDSRLLAIYTTATFTSSTGQRNDYIRHKIDQFGLVDDQVLKVLYSDLYPV